MSRVEARAKFTAATRLQLVETDVDTLETAVNRLATTINRFFIALVTAAILLAANIAVLGSRG
jgi:hypothetical protein